MRYDNAVLINWRGSAAWRNSTAILIYGALDYSALAKRRPCNFMTLKCNLLVNAYGKAKMIRLIMCLLHNL